jgi:hypothetical protein
VITPTPDGGTACADAGTPIDAREAACERRRLFERSGAKASSGAARFIGQVSSCAPPKVNAPGAGSICLDPRAMCRPDMFLGEQELSSTGQGGPPRPGR